MKNIIDHDSLQRVEPTAKNQAEAAQKQDADVAATVKATQDEQYLKETQTQDTDPAKEAENDLNQGRNPGRNPQEKSKKEKEESSENKNNFMGGQLFDAEA